MWQTRGTLLHLPPCSLQLQGALGEKFQEPYCWGPWERNSMPSMLPGLPPREREVGEEGRSALASGCNLDNFKKFQGLNLDE